MRRWRLGNASPRWRLSIASLGVDLSLTLWEWVLLGENALPFWACVPECRFARLSVRPERCQLIADSQTILFAEKDKLDWTSIGEIKDDASRIGNRSHPPLLGKVCRSSHRRSIN